MPIVRSMHARGNLHFEHSDGRPRHKVGQIVQENREWQHRRTHNFPLCLLTDNFPTFSLDIMENEKKPENDVGHYRANLMMGRRPSMNDEDDPTLDASLILTTT